MFRAHEFRKAVSNKGGETKVDILGIEPRASRMLSGCDTTTPCAHLPAPADADPAIRPVAQSVLREL